MRGFGSLRKSPGIRTPSSCPSTLWGEGTQRARPRSFLFAPQAVACTCQKRSSVLATRFVCVRVLPKPNSRKAIRTKSHARSEWSAGRRRVVGHATRTDVATRPRFGRGARRRMIRLRGPPASGALRLPALHHHRGSPPRLSTAAARVPLPLRGRPVFVNRRPHGEREDSLCY